jgi:3-isopropylmalate/(R)-2-methylmalate dehydratase small subunit
VQPLRRITSRTVVIASSDIDTDQIIPARFLTTTDKAGLGHGAEILVAGRNFGCGSSREHAPWALLDYGFRAVISTEIADIFRGNSLKNGFLPIVVDEQTSQWLLQHPGAELDIDLESKQLTLPTGASIRFPIEPFARHCLLHGLDELGYLRSKLAAIEQFEAARAEAPISRAADTL